MATQKRIFVDEALYEVKSEGVSGSNIFKDDEIKKLFSDELKITLKKYDYTCVSWSTTNDHYKLVVKASDIPISLFMQRLNSVFAKKFNKIKNRKGVVFYRRFASAIVQENAECFKTVLKYVHLNPVRSGCCTLKELCNYKWCGHAALLNFNGNDPIVDKNAVFKFFPGNDPVGSYKKFIMSEIYNQAELYIVAKLRAANDGLQRFRNTKAVIIGDSTFTKNTLSRARYRNVQKANNCAKDIVLETVH